MEPKEVMPFKKFVQMLKCLYHDEQCVILGKFKDKDGIFTEKFIAHKVGTGRADETYKMYLKWFNHTRVRYEWERSFVSATWSESNEKE